MEENLYAHTVCCNTKCTFGVILLVVKQKGCILKWAWHTHNDFTLELIVIID